MTEALAQCAHQPCTCAVAPGDYCSDHCRRADADEITCACGHTDCTGTTEDLDAAAG